MEHDIYMITPQMEAQLTHVIALLEDAVEVEEPDRRVVEALETLQALPFFKRW